LNLERDQFLPSHDILELCPLNVEKFRRQRTLDAFDDGRKAKAIFGPLKLAIDIMGIYAFSAFIF